jgi:hypothetical protein
MSPDIDAKRLAPVIRREVREADDSSSAMTASGCRCEEADVDLGCGSVPAPRVRRGDEASSMRVLNLMAMLTEAG